METESDGKVRSGASKEFSELTVLICCRGLLRRPDTEALTLDTFCTETLALLKIFYGGEISYLVFNASFDLTFGDLVSFPFFLILCLSVTNSVLVSTTWFFSGPNTRSCTSSITSLSCLAS